MSKNIKVVPFPPFRRSGVTITQRTAGDDLDLLNGSIHLNDDETIRLGNTLAANDAQLSWNTAQTVDALYLGLSDGQNTFIIAEKGDVAYDFAHGAQTNPTLFIQSATQSATEWVSFAHNQTNGVFNVGTGGFDFSTKSVIGIDALTIASMGGDWTNAGRTVADAGILTTVDINGGTIDGVTIGGSSAGAGTFSSVTTNTIKSTDAVSTTVTLQGQTFTAGAAHNTINFNPTWTAENFIHRVLLVNGTQNGANSASLQGIHFNLAKATAATTLADWYDIFFSTPDVTGTVTAKNCLYIQDQTNASVTTPRAIYMATAGVANSIVWGGSALQYANGAENIQFMDSTNTRGIGFTMTAAGNQTIASTGGTLVLTAPEIGAATGTSLLLGNGTAAAPAFSFSGATGTGMYQDSRLRFSNAGVNYMTLGVDGFTIIGTDGIIITNRNNNTPTQGLTITPYAITASTASTERTDGILINSATRTWATGALATQRFNYLEAPTVAFVGASVATDVYNLYIDAPIAGAFATITNNWALGVGGNVQIKNTLSLGIAGTSSGILTLSGSTSGVITIQPAVAAGTYTLTLPTSDGGASEFLQTDGAGILTWASVDTSGIAGTTSDTYFLNNNRLAGDTTDAAYIIDQGDGTNINSFRIRTVTATAELKIEYKQNPTLSTNLAEAYTSYFRVSPTLAGIYFGNTDLTYAYAGAIFTQDLPVVQAASVFSQTVNGNFYSGYTKTSVTNSQNIVGYIYNSGTSDTTITSVNAIGFASSPFYSATSGTLTGAWGFVARPRSTNASNTITNAGGFLYEDAQATGTITNQYGVKIPSFLMGTNNYGIEVAYGGVKLGVTTTTETIGFNMPTASVILGNQTATTTNVFGIRLGIPTYTSTTLVRTVTNLANLYIAGAPVASTNITVSAGGGPYALWVDADTSRFDGHLNSTQTTAPTSDLTGTTLNDGAGSGAAIAVTAGSTDTAGSFTVTAGNGTPGAGFAGDIVFNAAYTTAPKSVIITSKDADGTNNQIYVTAGTTEFSVFFNTALGTSEVVEYFYWVIE